MALVAYSRLPAFSSMRSEGIEVANPDVALRSELPDISIGLFNLMPDAALRATDRQFIRLVSAFADRANIWVYPFTVAAQHRSPVAREHIDGNYSTFEDLSRDGLDALIVTGANPAQDDLSREVFWEGMVTVLDWARDNVYSVLCSCLATHAVLKQYRTLERTRLPQKRWGVYSHGLLAPDHPYLAGLASPVAAPHSHWYDVTRPEMESVGLRVLAESEEAGVHMAVGDDDFYVFFQGHPEYDGISLLKEYRREVGRYFRGEIDEYPPYPEHYFDAEAVAVLEDYRDRLETVKGSSPEPPFLAEESVLPKQGSTWTEAGRVIYRNWLTEVLRQKRG